MSASELFSDIFHLEFTSAYHRLKDWYAGWPPQLKNLVNTLTDDEGKILWAAAEAASADVLGGKSLGEVADTVWETIKDQVPSKAKSDVADALGILKRSS